jgi:succinate dehydrogenase assembly factor 2
MLRIKHLNQLTKSLKIQRKWISDWEFIQPYPLTKENPEYGSPTIPVPPPLPRNNESLEQLQKRLIYSSRKRGILESDLLLGTFIKKYLSKLSHDQLKEYDELLNENDWDIYYWATGARHVPERIQKMSFWNVLVEHSKNKEKKVLFMPEL